MDKMKTLISPSILAADFAHLGDDVADVCARGIDYLHIDVMDGNFVPNISFGAAVMKSLNGIATVPYDVHLMVDEPVRYIKDFATDNTEFITVHYEACSDVKDTIRQIHDLGIKAGISIKPGTPVEELDDLLPDVDLVLIMSVEPGFGGQEFMDNSIPKVRHLKEKRDEMGLVFMIEADGGISSANAHLLKDVGLDIVVAGSAVFKAADRTREIEGIKA